MAVAGSLRDDARALRVLQSRRGRGDVSRRRAQLVWGSFVPGVLVPAVVCAAALSAMPRVLRTTARVARLSL
ncbi:hypothetical protein [Halogeometricum sp. CBA1124]|uniref:hypothetical protein n=1 Tax=Halogeometricum sp. CBA1124 TaxID=2668071 RepID=UPI0031B70963